MTTIATTIKWDATTTKETWSWHRLRKPAAVHRSPSDHWRHRCTPQPDLAFTDATLETAKKELAKDEANGVIGHDQAMKALDFAFVMLKEFMPVDERDHNATLAYIAAVARY